MGGIVFAFFKIQNALTKGGIRSDEDDEIDGLDLPEMGVLAYPDFVTSTDSLRRSGDGPCAVQATRLVHHS